MDYSSPLAKVRGLGSAKTGTSHWWMQRVTAVALIPLTFWIIIFLGLCINASYPETVAWLASPLNAVCIIAWILVVFYHAASGLQVVIDDYISNERWRIASIMSVNLLFLFLALAALIAVFRIILVG